MAALVFVERISDPSIVSVATGANDVQALLDRFNEISEKFAEPMSDDEMNALLEEQGKLQDAIDAAGGWEVDRKLEVAADALRLPPWDSDVTKLSGGDPLRLLFFYGWMTVIFSAVLNNVTAMIIVGTA